MDCRTFRNHHLAFTEDALPESEVVAMQAHLSTCECCSRYDTAMRRGLLVFRNLPAIEPSCDFFERLSCRLHQLERADAHAAMYRGPGVGSFLIAAASVVTVGFLAAMILNSSAPAKRLMLAPVVAMRPASPPSPVTSPVFVASASAGLPVWPAAMIAEQAPMRFADAELELASAGR